MSVDLLVALGSAVVLGLRHALDPDHLVAMTALTATDDRGQRAAVRLGAWWGLGHALTLLAVGLPLIALESALPGWLEAGAEKLVGVVIVVLTVRMLLRWLRRDRGAPKLRSAGEAMGIGVLHGLAGTGTVVVVLISALPSQLTAAAALGVFAPMTLISMAAMTGACAWVLKHPRAAAGQAIMVPALGAFGLAFGFWYAGIA